MPLSTARLGLATRFGLGTLSGLLLDLGGNSRVACGIRDGTGCQQGARTVPVTAGLVQAAADRGPAGACDGQRDFADDHNVTLR